MPSPRRGTSLPPRLSCPPIRARWHTVELKLLTLGLGLLATVAVISQLGYSNTMWGLAGAWLALAQRDADGGISPATASATNLACSLGAQHPSCAPAAQFRKAST